MRTLRPSASWPAGLAIALGLTLTLAGCAAQNQRTASANAAAAPAAAHATRGSACFRSEDVNGWRVGDDRTVYLRTGVNRVIRMTLFAPCPDINWSERVGIEARGAPWICSGLDATIIAPSPIGPRRCPVTEVHELTPAEIAALPRRQRP